MGVDYRPVGRVGIKITEEIRKKLVVANKGDFCGCMHELLDDLQLEYSEGGNGAYTGEENTFYLVIDGTTLIEVNRNVESFLKKLNDYELSLDMKDIIIIEDLCVW